MRNSTGISAIGFIKWIFIINSAVLLFKAYQGLIQRKIATGAGQRVGDLLTDSDAVMFGLECLVASIVFAAIAWALWFFWQQHEE